MIKFPRDAPSRNVVKALQIIGFEIVRTGNHISLLKENSDGTSTPLTMPNHETIKDPTLRAICNQSGISREDFLAAYKKA